MDYVYSAVVQSPEILRVGLYFYTHPKIDIYCLLSCVEPARIAAYNTRALSKDIIVIIIIIISICLLG